MSLSLEDILWALALISETLIFNLGWELDRSDAHVFECSMAQALILLLTCTLLRIVSFVVNRLYERCILDPAL